MTPTSALREARNQEARATLLRALEQLDQAEAEGGWVEAVVVVYATRRPDVIENGEPLVDSGVGYVASAIPDWQATGLMRAVTRRLEAE